MEQRCIERGARLLDFVVDFGAAKRESDDYPSLAYLRNGRADVLLVVRVPVVDSRQSGDLLESLAMPDGKAVAWVTVPQLRRLGLLPPAVDVPCLALQRATELRSKRFPFAAIARWLDTEGYAPDNGKREHWTGADVAKLLRQTGHGGDEQNDSPSGVEAAGLAS